MKIRTKVAIIIGMVSALTALMVIYRINTLLLSQFGNLEKSYANDTALRAANALNNDLDNLKLAVESDGKWDDTYLYINGQDLGFMYSNFGNPLSLSSFGCQIVLFLNTTGQLYGYVSYDASFQNLVLLPAGLLDVIQSHPEMWNFTSNEKWLTGVIPKGDVTYLYGSSPILPTNGTGPVQGAVILLSLLNSREISILEGRVGVPVKSEEGKGTTFTYTLPIKPPEGGGKQ